MVSESTTPFAKLLLMASINPAIWSLVLPAVLKSMVAASLKAMASSTVLKRSLFSCTSFETTFAVSA